MLHSGCFLISEDAEKYTVENKISFTLMLLKKPFQMILNNVSQTYLIIRTILGSVIEGVDFSAPPED